MGFVRRIVFALKTNIAWKGKYEIIGILHFITYVVSIFTTVLLPISRIALLYHSQHVRN